jgi:hypothetical protein
MQHSSLMSRFSVSPLALSAESKRKGATMDEDSLDDFVVGDDVIIDEVPDNDSQRLTLEEFRNQLPVWRAQNSRIALWPSTIPNAGMGVFALSRFEKGEPITEYRGYAISAAEADATPRELRTHFRQLFLRKVVLDGLRLENGTRITDPSTQLLGRGIGAFVNDARGPLNNAEFATFSSETLTRQLETEGVEVVKDATQKAIFLIALRTIQPYEEIFCSYGAAYDWN